MSIQCHNHAYTIYLYKYIVYAWYMHGICMVYTWYIYLNPICTLFKTYLKPI